MVSNLRLKRYIRGCKIIYFLIDNSKFETDVRLIIILYIKEWVLALCLFLGLLKFISSEWEKLERGPGLVVSAPCFAGTECTLF